MKELKSLFVLLVFLTGGMGIWLQNAWAGESDYENASRAAEERAEKERKDARLEEENEVKAKAKSMFAAKITELTANTLKAIVEGEEREIEELTRTSDTREQQTDWLNWEKAYPEDLNYRKEVKKFFVDVDGSNRSDYLIKVHKVDYTGAYFDSQRVKVPVVCQAKGELFTFAVKRTRFISYGVGTDIVSPSEALKTGNDGFKGFEPYTPSLEFTFSCFKVQK
ncbi:MAG: hypothetical protein K1X29_04375 [Bdellovibrionales bacterium]|nr:hypothetical protein [Bdellovibrionales bacterium]